MLVRTGSVNFDNLQSSYEESVYYATQPNGFDDPWTARAITGMRYKFFNMEER